MAFLVADFVDFERVLLVAVLAVFFADFVFGLAVDAEDFVEAVFLLFVDWDFAAVVLLLLVDFFSVFSSAVEVPVAVDLELVIEFSVIGAIYPHLSSQSIKSKVYGSMS